MSSFQLLPRGRHLRAALGLWLAAVVLLATPRAIAAATSRTELPRSLYGASPSLAAGQQGRVIRSLSESERQERFHFSVALRLRDRARLERRIAAGEVLTLEQLRRDHLPTRTQWTAVAGWAEREGLTVAPRDNSCMTVFAEGTIAKVERALQLQFARVVGTDGRQYNSAVTTPSLPSDVAETVSGLLHLQPHVRPVPHNATSRLTEAGFILPQSVARFYNALDLGLTGRGEVIVVRGDAVVDRADLVAFWTNTGLPITLAQYTEVDPPAATSSTCLEFTMDVEWASAMAPGAQIVYFGHIDVDRLLSWITSRPADAPPIRQTTLSVGLPEACYVANGSAPIDTEYYAALAALGINNFVSSGDHGSNAATDRNVWPGENIYTYGTTLTIGYPASDPFVVAVGGTTLQAPLLGTPGGWREGAWSLPTNLPPEKCSGYSASTGGVSLIFDRPVWQTGAALPVGGRRLVPDVAAVAMSDRLLYFVCGGNEWGAGGTSLSAPVWAGLSALIHEGLRAGGGRPGFLPPRLYAQIGTGAFHQITTGANRDEPLSPAASNGAYGVARDYSLLTGLGTPNIAKLIATLGGTLPAAPAIVQPPVTTTVGSGQTARFSVVATGTGPLSYQWLMEGVIVHDGLQANMSIIAGAQTANLVIQNAQVTQDSDSVFRSFSGRRGVSVIVSSQLGVAVADGAKLHVSAPAEAPVILDPPTSRWGLDAVIGDDLELNAPAHVYGTNLTYQWYHNGVAIAGATGRQCVIPHATPADGGIYLVMIGSGPNVISSPVLPIVMTEARFIAPVVKVPLQSTTIYAGEPVRLTVGAEAPGPIAYSWSHDGVTIPGATARTHFIRSAQARDAGRYQVLLQNEMLSGSYSEATLTFDSSMTWPSIAAPGQGSAQPGGTVRISAPATGTPAPSVQWQQNGRDLRGRVGAELVLPALQPADAGLYTATAVNAAGRAQSSPAIVGVRTDEKVVGSGRALDADVRHPNGNIFDQVLVTGPAEAVSADAHQITRTSYIDLDDDIVQVEFSGAGTLCLVLDDASAPAPPMKYNQDITYVKGHAGIVIVGADETTNLSVFTVGRLTAYDPTGHYDIRAEIGENNDPAQNGNPLFVGHPTSTYDGIADLAFVAISSVNGKFGSIRTANAHYFSSRGVTGIYAPGVAIQGALYLGDLTAFDAALPVIQVGAAADVRIAGGNLLQDNGAPVVVEGLERLNFTSGTDSHGRVIPKQSNRAVLEQDGQDVTEKLVIP